MIVLLAILLVIVLPVALMTASAFLLNPRDPLLHNEKPWSCSRCEGEWPDLASFFGHACQRVTQ